MSTGGVLCLRDDVCLYDLVWFASLYWLLVYCGSSTYNVISCLAGFFFCTSHFLVILRPSIQSFRRCQEERPHWQVIVEISKHLQWSINESKLKSRMLFSFFYPHVLLRSTLIHLTIMTTTRWWRWYHVLYLAIQSSLSFILSTNLIPTTQADGESQQKSRR